MDNQCAKCMTIGAIIETFSSITLCTLTFYFKPQLLQETKLSILIIYYGYLILNLLIVTIILTCILILASFPFMGSQSIKFLAFTQPMFVIFYRCSYYIYPIFYCFVYDTHILIFHVKFVWCIFENIDAIYQYCWKFSFNVQEEEQATMQQIQRDVYQRYHQYI